MYYNPPLINIGAAQPLTQAKRTPPLGPPSNPPRLAVAAAGALILSTWAAAAAPLPQTNRGVAAFATVSQPPPVRVWSVPTEILIGWLPPAPKPIVAVNLNPPISGPVPQAPPVRTWSVPKEVLIGWIPPPPQAPVADNLVYPISGLLAAQSVNVEILATGNKDSSAPAEFAGTIAVTHNDSLPIDLAATGRIDAGLAASLLGSWRADTTALAELLPTLFRIDSLPIDLAATGRADFPSLVSALGSPRADTALRAELLPTLFRIDSALISSQARLINGWSALLQWASLTPPPPPTQGVFRRALKAAAGAQGRTIYRRFFLGVPSTALQVNQPFRVAWLAAGQTNSLIITAATPIIAVNPTSPQIADTTPLGAVVATYVITMSDSSLFIGTIAFGPPNFDSGRVFALSPTDGVSGQVIVNPSGPGVGPNITTVTDHITLLATTSNFGPSTLIEWLTAERQDANTLPAEVLASMLSSGHLSGDTSGQIEWASVKRADAGASISWLATERADGGGRLEWVASLANSGALIIECAPTHQINTSSFAEWTGSIGVVRNDGLLVELTAVLRADALPEIKEFIATQQHNTPTTNEFFGTQRQEGTVFGEVYAKNIQDVTFYDETIASQNLLTAASIEELPTSRQDAPLPGDGIATVQQGIPAPDEFSVNERQDGQGPAESIATQQRNVPTANEFSTTSRGDTPAQTELFVAELSDTSALAELANMQKKEDALLPLELSSAERADTLTQAELAASDASDTPLLLSLSSAQITGAETAPFSLPLESLVTERADSVAAGAEFVSGERRDDLSANAEILGAQLAETAPVQVDASSGLLANAPAVQEAIASARADAFMLADILSGGRSDNPCFLDFTSAQRIDAPPNNIEWLAAFRINGSGGLPIELVAIIRTDEPALAEWLVSAGTHLTSDIAALVEWLATPGFRFGSDGGLGVEWQANTHKPGPGQVIIARANRVLKSRAFRALKVRDDLTPKGG